MCDRFPAVGQTASEAENLNGAGATFPYPVYAKWGARYNQLTGLKLTYQAIGSGGGIAQIKAKTVDFGASDEPLEAEALDKSGLIQFPMIMGGVVQVVNIEGVSKGKLKLTPEILADIFLGRIRNWNDRRIMAVNPDLKLPDREITVVHRADGSGTTWILTNYLSKVSPEWKEKLETTSRFVAYRRGGQRQRRRGGSSEKDRRCNWICRYAYALRERLKHVQLQNRSGKFVNPTTETFQAAAANADWEKASGFYMVLTDQPGDKSWPITGASYILVHKDQPDPSKAETMLKFFDWCFKNGSEVAIDLHYVPIPAKVCNLVKAQWAKEVTAGGKLLWK